MASYPPGPTRMVDLSSYGANSAPTDRFWIASAAVGFTAGNAADRYITPNDFLAEITRNISDLTLQFGNGVTGTVSAAGKGKIRYNNTTGTFQASLNTAAYTNLLTGSGTATRVAFWSGAGSLSHNANFYWDDTNSRLGIGVGSSPQLPVDVAADGSALAQQWRENGAGTARVQLQVPSSFGLIGTSTNHDFGIITNGTQRVNVEKTGGSVFGSIAAATATVTVNAINASDVALVANNATTSTTDIAKLQVAGSNRFLFNAVGNATFGLASTIDGQLTLASAGAAFTQAFKAGTAPVASNVFRWPNASPIANQVLSASAPVAGVVTLSWTTPTTVTPGGVTNSVQINNGGGGFDGDAWFTYDTASHTVLIGSATTVGTLKLRGTGVSNGISFNVNSPAGNYVYTWPDALPTVNNVLTATAVAGSNVTLGWAAANNITVGTTTITGGTSGRIPYNNTGVYGEISGLSTNGSTTLVQTSANAAAFESGPNGSTNPVFRLVNSTANSATGLSITGNAAGSGVSLTTLSSGTNETLNIKARGENPVNIDGSGTTNPTIGVFSVTVGNNNNVGNGLRLIRPVSTNYVGVEFSTLTTINWSIGPNANGLGIFESGSAATTAVMIAPTTRNVGIGTTTNINSRLTLQGELGFTSASGTAPDAFFRRVAAANLALGAADAVSPVAQTLSVQSVIAGTTNTAGVDWTFKGSAGTGTGAGGSIVLSVAPAGSTGTAQNTFNTQWKFDPTGTSSGGRFAGYLTSSTTLREAARYDHFWINSTDASRTAAIAQSLVVNATINEYTRLSSPSGSTLVNLAIHAGTAPNVYTSGTQAVKLYLLDAASTPAVGVAAAFSNTILDVGAWQVLKGRGTNASPTGVQSADVLGEFQFNGYYSTTTNSIAQGALLRASTTETWTSSANGTSLFFYLASTGSTIAEKMSLRSTGTLRINATSGSFDSTTLLQIGNYASWGVNVTAAIYSQANGTTPLQLIGTSGQTANLLTVFNDTLAANLFAINSVGVASVRSGLGTASGNKANLGGTLNINITPATNTSTTQTDLITYSLPANTLGTNGDRVEVVAYGAFNTTANSKRLKMFFGATAIFDTGSLIFNGGAWKLTAVITRFGAAVQTAITVFDGNLALLTTNCQETVPGETLSGAVTIKCTGQGGASNDVIQDQLIVSWFPNA